MSQANRSPRDFVGLVPPFSLTRWEAESSYTESSPVVGTAVPSEPTAGRLVTSGSQTAGGSVEVQVRAPGFAGRDSAAIVWRNTGDTRWRGQDAPVAMSGWESVTWVDGTAAILVATYNPHAVTLDDGQVLVAYGYSATSPSTLYGVHTRRRSADGSAWSTAVLVHSQATDLTRGFHPCLLLMPSGRVLLFHGIMIGTDYQLRIWYSDDNGDTWALHTDYALAVSIDTADRDPGTLRIAYDGRQMLLIIQTRDTDTAQGATKSHDSLWQWVSSDYGASFTPVQDNPSVDDDKAGSAPDVVALPGGGFLLAWGVWTDAHGYYLGSVRLPNAYTDYTTLTVLVVAHPTLISAIFIGSATAGVSSYEMTSGDLALAMDPAGFIWCWCQDAAGTPAWAGVSVVTADYGVTWTALGVDQWWDSQDASTTPRRYSAVWWRGSALILHQWSANPGIEDNSVACMRLGGWSTVTMPRLTQAIRSRTRPPWTRTWIPIELPSDMGWTATGAGTAALTSGSMNIATVANTKYYSLTWTSGNLSDGITLLAWVQPLIGGSLNADNIAINLRLDDGAASESYEISIRFTTTGYRVYDIIAGATVTSSVTVDTTNGIQILAGINDGQVFVAYWTGTGSDRKFTISHDGEALTDGGGTALTRRIQFGNIASATAQGNWKMLNYATATDVGTNWAAGQTSPDDQWPGPLPSSPGYIDDGILVRGEIGPFVIGDSFTIAARSDFAVGQLFFSEKPSYRRCYASSATTAHNMAYRLVDGYSTAGLQEAAIVLFLAGCNWRTGVLARYRAGTWSAVATIDLASGMTSLPYTRTGNVIHVNTAGAATTGAWYMHRNALIGATVDLGGGKLRKVTANSDGMWTTGSAADMRRPRLVLAGVDDTEGSSGTCNIWMPGGAIVIHLAGTNAEAAGYRLTIDSQTIVDTGFTAKAHLGPLVTFVVQPDTARTVTHAGNVEEIEYRDGTTRRIQRGPTRRSVTIGWQDQLIPEHHVAGASPAPSYAMGTSAANARALAALGAEPFTMAGLLEDLDGASLPVGYIGYVPRGSTSPSVHHILRPDLHLVGYATPEARIENVRASRRDTGGGPYAGTLTRIAEITIKDLP